MALTKMQQFAVDLIKKQNGESINPNHLAYQWALSKNRVKAASRDMFGYTSAAYKCLRKLALAGTIQRRDTNCGNYTDEQYSIINKN